MLSARKTAIEFRENRSNQVFFFVDVVSRGAMEQPQIEVPALA